MYLNNREIENDKFKTPKFPNLKSCLLFASIGVVSSLVIYTPSLVALNYESPPQLRDILIIAKAMMCIFIILGPEQLSMKYSNDLISQQLKVDSSVDEFNEVLKKDILYHMSYGAGKIMGFALAMYLTKTNLFMYI